MPAPVPPSDSLFDRLRQGIGAWHPFTGHGVAAFAFTGFFRLFSFQMTAALGIAGVVVWALHQTWFPVIHRALPQLPEAAAISSGSLSWPGYQPQRLAQNPWLDIVVSPNPNLLSPALGQTADLQLEFLPTRFRIDGVLGQFSRPYPPIAQIDLGRLSAIAAWEAWRLTTSVFIGCSVALGLPLAWWFLSSIYCIPSWILARSLSRPVGIAAVWRMAGAALLVGALLSTASIAAYAIGMVRLPGFLLSQILHIPVGLIWLGWGILRLPSGSRPRKTDANPFRPSNKSS